jgi:hypothetical protein
VVSKETENPTMDAAAFAAQSDPDRNPNFRRRWSDDAQPQRGRLCGRPVRAFDAIVRHADDDRTHVILPLRAGEAR